jgi:signal transduction histidine kinase
LIQQESGRLKELVEQVLRFAGAESGRVIQQPEPLSVETVIEEALDSMQGLIQGGRCTLEKNIEPGLPPVLGRSRLAQARSSEPARQRGQVRHEG